MQPFDKISIITIAVADQDEALTWFTQVLGFEKRTDQRSGDMRWLTVAPEQQAEVEFLLASWFPDRVGKNPTWVISTRDCEGGCAQLRERGVVFVQEPAVRPWGIEAVFEDLYGNHYALVQESAQALTDAATEAALGVDEPLAQAGVIASGAAPV